MANQKLTELTATATVAATDIIYVVTTPGATPASRKATVSALVAGAGGPTTIPVPIAQGGTAGTTARLARDNLLLHDNNEPVRMLTSAAATVNVLKMSATNVLEITGSAAIRALTAFEAASTVTLENNTYLRLKNASGVAQNTLRMDTGNAVALGSPTILYLNGTIVHLGAAVTSLRMGVNNQPLQGYTVGSVVRQKLKLNASDVLELGDVATPSITAMTALNVTGNLTATGTGAVKAGGFVTGTTGALAAGSHGITSVSRSSAGVYVVTWSAARSSALYPVTVTPVIATAARATVTLTTTTATVRTFDAADAAADADFTVMMA